jgi:hypothetical protein
VQVGQIVNKVSIFGVELTGVLYIGRVHLICGALAPIAADQSEDLISSFPPLMYRGEKSCIFCPPDEAEFFNVLFNFWIPQCVF